MFSLASNMMNGHFGFIIKLLLLLQVNLLWLFGSLCCWLDDNLFVHRSFLCLKFPSLYTSQYLHLRLIIIIIIIMRKNCFTLSQRLTRLNHVTYIKSKIKLLATFDCLGQCTYGGLVPISTRYINYWSRWMYFYYKLLSMQSFQTD